MFSCIVYGCTNSTLTNTDPSIHYYFFPKHPIYAQQWIQACGWQSTQIDLNTARICSIHFDNDSYSTEVKIIDYITCYSKILKYDAIPTLFLPTTQFVIKETEANGQEIKGMIVFTLPSTSEENVLESSNNPKEQYIELQIQPSTSANNVKIESNDEEKYIRRIKTKHDLIKLQEQNKELGTKIEIIENDIKQLQTGYTKILKKYQEKDLELNKYRQQYLKRKTSALTLQEQKQLLLQVFSESQIKILSGKKKIYWSNDDMAVGYTIRHLSNKRCYSYLTKTLNIPLPAVSSIKRWIALKNRKKDEKYGDSE